MAGNNARFRFIEQCYNLYEQKMYQIAYGILRDVEMAEDAVQTAFEKMMKHGRYFKDATSVECKQYIITVIRNTSFDFYKQRRNEEDRWFLSDHEELFEAEETDEQEQKEQLIHYYRRLPGKYRDVVKNIAFDNCSVRETAEILEISESSVRKRYERAKNKIREMMEGGDERD